MRRHGISQSGPVLVSLSLVQSERVRDKTERGREMGCARGVSSFLLPCAMSLASTAAGEMISYLRFEVSSSALKTGLMYVAGVDEAAVVDYISHG